MSMLEGTKKEGVQIKGERESKPVGNEKPAECCDEKRSSVYKQEAF